MKALLISFQTKYIIFWYLTLNQRNFNFLQVNTGSKAEKSGLREGDLITEINGIQPINLDEAKQLQKSTETGLCLKLIQ